MNRGFALQDHLRRDIETLNFPVRGEERKLESQVFLTSLEMVKERRQKAKARAKSIRDAFNQ
jgi:hypothetical protein